MATKKDRFGKKPTKGEKHQMWRVKIKYPVHIDYLDIEAKDLHDAAAIAQIKLMSNPYNKNGVRLTPKRIKRSEVNPERADYRIRD